MTTRTIHVRNMKDAYLLGNGPVYVGRFMPRQANIIGPTDGFFGNPFSVDQYGDLAGPLFVAYFLERLRLDPKFRTRVEELRGKRLACWCHPKPCHADVIAAWLDGDQALIDARREVYGWSRAPKAAGQGDLFKGGGKP